MTDKCTKLQRGKAIKVGPHTGCHPLDLGVISGWVLVECDNLEIGAKMNPGVPVKTSVSSCQTRFMTISVARMDVATIRRRAHCCRS